MIFFSSDHHFWHENVIRYCNRPYSNVAEMNEALIANWNSVVSPEDTVYYLGDFSLAIRAVETISSRLNGKKYLIPGNHDWCHSYHKKSRSPENREKWIKKYEEHGWIVLPEQHIETIDGLELYFCHHPVATGDFPPEDGYDKYHNWRPLLPNESWLICGHVHEKWKIRGNMINVGVDSWDMKPVSLQEISNIVLGVK